MMAFHEGLQDLDPKLSIGQINSIIKIRVKYLRHADEIVICTKEKATICTRFYKKSLGLYCVKNSILQVENVIMVLLFVGNLVYIVKMKVLVI